MNQININVRFLCTILGNPWEVSCIFKSAVWSAMRRLLFKRKLVWFWLSVVFVTSQSADYPRRLDLIILFVTLLNVYIKRSLFLPQIRSLLRLHKFIPLLESPYLFKLGRIKTLYVHYINLLLEFQILSSYTRNEMEFLHKLGKFDKSLPTFVIEKWISYYIRRMFPEISWNKKEKLFRFVVQRICDNTARGDRL